MSFGLTPGQALIQKVLGQFNDFVSSIWMMYCDRILVRMTSENILKWSLKISEKWV